MVIESEGVLRTRGVEHLKRYLDAYMDEVRKAEPGRDELPEFYRTHPFKVTGIVVPDGGMIAVYARDKVLAISAKLFDEDIELEHFDYLTYHDAAEMSSGDPDGRGRRDARADIELARALASQAKARDAIARLVKGMEELVRKNPWLDSFRDEHMVTASQLEGALELLERTTRERIGTLLEAKRGAVLALLSSPAPRAAVPEPGLEQIRKEMHERMGGVSAALGALEERLDRLEREALRSEDLSGALKRLKESISTIEHELASLSDKFEELKKDVEVSEEIKATVFRDTKRMHSLNERVVQLEKSVPEMSVVDAIAKDLKGLEARLDKMAKDLPSQIAASVSEEFDKRVTIEVQTAKRSVGAKTKQRSKGK
ncbi:MAG: hypothetical protein AB1665_06830 [Candidatus Thermoplasmatota archaeon]